MWVNASCLYVLYDCHVNLFASPLFQNNNEIFLVRKYIDTIYGIIYACEHIHSTMYVTHVMWFCIGL